MTAANSHSEAPATVPMPHDRYKVETCGVGEDGDAYIVFGLHDVERARLAAAVEYHANVCWPEEHEVAADGAECDLSGWGAKVGWWRQRPALPDEDYLWFLVRAKGPGPGARPAVYLHA